MANFMEKRRLKREINLCLQTINEIERRRTRSQAALVQAILLHELPDDEDIEWFNKYTGEIASCRKHLAELKHELEALG